jgi:cardiolipin synthase (CMP-forming)
LGYLAASALFLLACLTDFLDGYVARVYKQETSIGRFLDPLADKLLVAAVIIMLAGFDRLQGFTLIPAIIILCREILVSGLREFLGKMNEDLPVTDLAKWKTALQMVSLGCLIISDPDSVFAFALYIGIPGLWLAAFLTVLSGYDYLKQTMKHARAKDHAGHKRETILQQSL